MLIPPIISKTIAVNAFTALTFLSATSVSAINITGVTASTNMGTNHPAIDIQNTVNGAGLPSNTPALTGLHDRGDNPNVWFSSNGVTTGNIDFNLGGSYNLSGFSFWNLNAHHGAGINGVIISTSTDGSAFTSLAGAPTQFSLGQHLSSQNPEIFAFSPTLASYVRFTVTSNYGDNTNTGFSEVQFDGTAATPVPFDFDPSLGFVSLGVVFGINKWRKNNKKAP